jgi:hypothetical protein
MALVPEDGTIVDGANSYNSLAEIRAFADVRNATLSDDDDVVTGQAILAMDYIEAYRNEFRGERVSAAQELSFPRTGIAIDFIKGVQQVYADDEIPPMLKAAQCMLVIVQSRGIELQPAYSSLGRIRRSKTGPIEKEFFDSGASPVLTAVDALLAPLLNMATFGIRTIRV